jgi:FeS assembly SUF system protein
MTHEEETRTSIGVSFVGAGALQEPIVAALKTVFDPEIPVDVYELGLVYQVKVEGTHATVRMTLTSPACPAAESIPVDVKEKLESIEGIETCDVEIVWEPIWTPDLMSEAAKLELGMF